jgi:peptide-methionine (R)-S-oxide reductase
MLTRRLLLAGGALSAAAASGLRALAAPGFRVTHTDAEWRKLLTPAQYNVLRSEGTEAPGSSPLNREHRAGMFVCAADQTPLFSSKTKFESGTGWPSFYEPLAGGVGTKVDRTFGMVRTAVFCTACGGHLGHMFPDGPKPTGLRYCMNGVAMGFKPA